MLTMVFINLGYILYATAIVVHDVLWLRCILIGAHSSLVTYGLISGNYWVVFWNTVFISINALRIVHILNDRKPIELPAELKDLYETLFTPMSSREFYYFWQTGSLQEASNELLVKEDERQTNLLLILSGTVNIVSNGTVIGQRSRGNFIAEMSFLSNETASADVIADGHIKYISWAQDKLRSLDQLNPQLLIKLQSVIGKNLSDKIQVSMTTAGQHTSGEINEML
jgi:CRP-like cAMP-binding protein